jgi:putative Ig domain-containing protein
VQIFNTATRTGTLIGSLIVASLLTACGSGSEDAGAAGSASGTPSVAAEGAAPIGGGYPAPEATTPLTAVQAPVVPGAAAAPTITGSPATAVRTGAAYNFQPTAADANGDTLRFSISGKPNWATFDAATGKLAGTPGAGDIGSASNVSITVSDGTLTASLAPFSILVSAGTTGSATLSWTPPTANSDGSSLNNLAGYRIYYGTKPDALATSIQITNPGLTNYTVGNLNSGTYYFSIAAYTADGVEGAPSAVASKSM